MKLIKSNDVNDTTGRLHIFYRNESSFLVQSPIRGGLNLTTIAPKFVGATMVDSKKAHLMAVPSDQIESFIRYFSGTNETILVDIATSNHLERMNDDRVNVMRNFLRAEYTKNFIRGSLMDFQKKGVAFLRYKKNTILADDMGLGKTIQTIEFLLRERSDSLLTCALIVVPASLKIQWKREIEAFSPTDQRLSIQIIDGHPTIRETQWLLPVDIVIVNYETLCNDIEYGFVKQGKFSHIIVDEASYIKNPSTKRAKCVRAVGKTCESRLALTGTPLENHVEELWSIGNFVDPDVFGSRSSFKKRYDLLIKRKIKPEEERQRQRQLNDLRSMLRNVMVRRRKVDVLDQLPAITITRHDVQLHPVAQRVHDTLAASLRELTERYSQLSRQERTQQISEIMFALSHQILAKLTYMREVCLMPELIIQDESVPNVKLARLLEILDDMNGDDKVVIFTEYRRVAEMLQSNIPNSVIVHGGIEQADRQAIVDRFKTDPSINVMVTTSVFQFGVNLQFANYVVNYDLHYNPAKMAQRIDRLHRMGQQRNVTVINLVVNNSIEESIEAILIRKYNLFCAVVEGQFVASNFTDQGAITELATSVVRQARTRARATRNAAADVSRSTTVRENVLSHRFESIVNGFDPRFVRVLRSEAIHMGEDAWWHEMNMTAQEWNVSPADLLRDEETQYLESLRG